jgi:hypothetical protein
MTLANTTKLDSAGYRLREQLTIAAGESLSDVSEAGAQGYLLATIGIPAGFTTGLLGMRGSSTKTPTPLAPMGYEDGTEIVLSVTASTRVVVVPTTYQGLPYIQLASGPSDSLSTQGAPVVFDLTFVRAE